MIAALGHAHHDAVEAIGKIDPHAVLLGGAIRPDTHPATHPEWLLAGTH